MVTVADGRILHLAGSGTQPAGWFRRGRLQVQDGAASGLWSTIKQDRPQDGLRLIELWEPLRAAIAPGDQVTLISGCDKRFATCRVKFGNLVNFQGFPDLPGDGWMLRDPATGPLRGGSRR